MITSPIEMRLERYEQRLHEKNALLRLFTPSDAGIVSTKDIRAAVAGDLGIAVSELTRGRGWKTLFLESFPHATAISIPGYSGKNTKLAAWQGIDFRSL